MSYIDHINTMKASGRCPFCDEQHYAVDESEYAFVLPARAPYTEDHILICSKRHISQIEELTPEESHDIYALVMKREQILHARHPELVVFLRQGKPFGVTGKSLHHFHRHIVPNFTIKYGGTQEASDNRLCYDDETYQEVIGGMKLLSS